jgi:UPF0716 protein FxsA
MLPVLGLLLLAIPVVELAVILAVGDQIGYLNTLGLLILISVVGAVLVKREGTATWRRLQTSIRGGVVPHDEVIDGALILFGGALLLTPGFVTDLVGLLFVFPGTRAIVKRSARKVVAALALKRFGAAGVAVSTGRKVYQARATNVRRAAPSSSTPETLPSAPPTPSDEDDSPGTR